MAYIINIGLNSLKWPIGLLMVVLLVPMAEQLWAILRSLSNQSRYETVLLGAVAYVVFMVLFGRSRFLAWLHTFNHEMTHIVTALFTLNRVTQLTVTDHRGGSMSYEGFGNWLITIAPYFVPLPLLLLSGLMLVVKDQWYALLLPVLGFVTVSHLHYLKAQLHTGQTDLKQVGWLFTWLFLPGANVLMLTLVTLLTLGGQPLGAYVGELERELLTMLSEAQRFIKHYS